MSDFDHLPYRPCVGLMLLDPRGRVFAGQRIDNPGSDAWQMPQGGIDPGEDPVTAGLRELEEETGIPRARVSLIRESAGWIDYDLPPELKGKIWKGRYRGQTQKWLALRFLGADSEVNIATEHAEFSRWDWMHPGELIEKIVPFKTHVYRAVFEEFSDLL